MRLAARRWTCCGNPAPLLTAEIVELLMAPRGRDLTNAVARRNMSSESDQSCGDYAGAGNW